MTVTHGQDPARVREVASHLGKLAEDMRTVRGAGLTSMNVLGAAWEGDDLAHFDRQWHTSAGHLEEAASRLRDAQEALLRQADQQEETSGGTGRTASPPYPERREPSLWDRITDGVGDVVDGVGDALEDAWDWAGDTAEGAWDWATGTAQDVWDWGRDRFDDAVDWVGDRASDAWDAVTGFFDDHIAPRWEAATAAWDRLWPSLQNAGSQITQIFTEGRWPRFHEVLTNSLLVLGQTGGLVANVLTGEDHRFMHSGTGTVGEPRSITPTLDNQTMPTDLVGLLDSMSSAYGDGENPREVRITEVTQGNPPTTAYIVTVPGTDGLFDADSMSGTDNAFDNTSNLQLQAGQRSASMEAVMAAMEAHDIPQGAPVMLFGHSQGGMVTGELVQDAGFMADYNVTHMITEGSPNDSRSIPPGVQTLAIEHSNDLVTKLDFGDAYAGPPVPVPLPGPLPTVVLPMTPIPNFDPALAGSGEHVHQVRIDPNPGVGGLTFPEEQNAHHYDQYTDSVIRELDNGSTAFDGFTGSPGFDQFLSGDPSQVRVTQYPTERVD